MEADRDRHSSLLGLLVVAVSAVYTPATLWATQPLLIPRPYRLLVIAAVQFGVLFVLAQGVRALGVGRRTAYFIAALAGLVFMQGARFGSLSVAIAAILSVGIIVYLARDSAWLDVVVVVFVVVAGLSPVGQYILNSRTLAPASLNEPPPLPAVRAEVGKAWILVLDGYPSSWAWENIFGQRESSLVTFLAESGFAVNGNALAPYPWTALAIPSVLDGRPVASPGSPFGASEKAAVSDRLGRGESSLLRALQSEDRPLTIIESGWHLLRCRQPVDFCIPSHPYDEAADQLWSQSALKFSNSVPGGSAQAQGAAHTFSHLMRIAEETRSKDGVVFAHVLAPHPPLVLDSQCDLRKPDPALGSLFLGSPVFGPELTRTRSHAFVDQVLCVERYVRAFVKSVPPDDVVVIFGDHGTDLLGQSFVDLSEWSREMFRERFLTLAAMRVPDCGETPTRTIDIPATLLECLGLEVVSGSHDPLTLPSSAVRDSGDPEVGRVPPEVLEDLLMLALVDGTS
jgi:hypothetical protein